MKKDIERIKRESTNTIYRCCAALKTINFNRDDVDLVLFHHIVAKMAIATNELMLLSKDIKED